ncbi:MAG: diguanylate cyclase [candidate division Zixibacteria bacterium]|nr:diguanylate cyclase [candidate division Zixibacteria bacterium]
MQSTKSTILENWPGPKTTELPRKPVYHFAIRQHGVDLDFRLEQFFQDRHISLHYFESFEELAHTCHRYAVDVILIGGRDDFLPEIELVRTIRNNTFTAITPIILVHPDPDENTIVAAYENGAEDFIYGEWRPKLEEVRIQRVISRSRRDLAVNPSTQLPGPSTIEQEIVRQIDMGAEIAICYADLDNFKAYNDYYGYHYGDKVVRLTARIIKDVVFDLCPEGFVGHIAGDDFIYIIPPQLIDEICTNVLTTFDRMIPYRYKEEDRVRGHIESVNRRGDTETYPLLTLSIAVLVNSNGKFQHIGELSKMLADLKKATKAKEGSNYMVERRRKY